MSKRKVKEKFREDFNINFYNFEGDEIHNSLKKEINNHNNLYANIKPKKKIGLVLMTRAMALFILTLVIVSTGKYFTNKSQSIKVEELFALENVEYVDEPVLVTSSYAGEELRIYQVIMNFDGTKITQYYYYFTEINNNTVESLYFVNRESNISINIDPKENFGNLSELIGINLDDNVEVGLIYNKDKVFTQFFTAVSIR